MRRLKTRNSLRTGKNHESVETLSRGTGLFAALFFTHIGQPTDGRSARRTDQRYDPAATRNAQPAKVKDDPQLKTRSRIHRGSSAGELGRRIRNEDQVKTHIQFFWAIE
jgi:hypothetical protein